MTRAPLNPDRPSERGRRAVRIQVALDDQLLAAIDAYSAESGIDNRSLIIRLACQRGLPELKAQLKGCEVGS